MSLNPRTPPAKSSVFATANPHALATILEASETRTIIAATDIFDLAGTKLWARNQPVSSALQRRLLDRQLREPLEACLVAEDGVTASSLCAALAALVEEPSELSILLRPHSQKLLREAAQLPLHPVVQLLLTAGQTARPAMFDHAVRAMAVAGALMLQQGGQTPEVRLALLAGLVHDLGEMYIAPEFGEAEADRELDEISYRQLVVHPHVGHLLVTQLTNYPSAIARAVAEHHERLDGSGYPHRLAGEQISSLGRLMAVADTVLRVPDLSLRRASVALRAVPGEFDVGWIGPVSQAASRQGTLMPVLDRFDVRARRAALGEVLTAAEQRIATLDVTGASPAMRSAHEVATFLVHRLRTGWNESGLWHTGAAEGNDAGEVEAIQDELYFRLRAVQRALLTRLDGLSAHEVARLQSLCEALPMARTD